MQQSSASKAHAVGSHPRRPPAHRSVSLLHSSQIPGGEEGSAAGSTQANPSSSPPSKRGTQGNSSGESSNAEHWFEKNNNNVKAELPNFDDNDPPFFLRNSSSGDTPPDRQLFPPPPGAILPYRTGLAATNTANSSSEDFRSVIDDLTIENKRLKKKLKKYEKLHNAHLHEDKLFEIRVHGLPPDKKQELEEYLKRFALTMEKSPATNTVTTTTRTGSSGAGYESSRPSLRPHHTKSSYTSHLTDSAYASMSASGQQSAPASGQELDPRKYPRSVSSQQQQRQQSIHSYLQDIPAGLMPKQPTPMSDRSRKRLVVRRLEQIFAGKGAAVGGHQQPIQQQEIAQSAAKADRTALEESGVTAKKEGHREARIMPGMEKDAMEVEKIAAPAQTPVQPILHKGVQKARDALLLRKVDAVDFVDNGNGNESPDQRPTRPLDLDPYRAQVPADNIEYIRHLGFSPLDPSASSPIDGHGWIYLNVLTNMAQLHTLNVTADFVRMAVTEYSRKFEVSKDGRKLRWRGGQDVTRNSSDDGTPDHGGAVRSGLRGASKWTNPSQSTSDVSSEEFKAKNRLAYVPLFAHKDESEDDMESSSNEESDESSPLPGQVTASSGFNSSGMLGSNSKKRRNDDGPIIFYNRARFITDLSGNRRAFPYKLDRAAEYQALPTRPVGTLRGDSTDSDCIMEDVRGPLDNISPTTSAEGDISSTPSDRDVTFMADSVTDSRPGVDHFEPIEFEASGIGGVRPQDNFAIDVRSRHVSLLGEESTATFLSHPLAKSYPKQIRDILGDDPNEPSKGKGRRTSQTHPVIREQIISSRKRDLPASALPEASYLPFDSMDEESDDDSDGNLSDGNISTLSRPAPTIPPQQIAMHASSSGSELGSASESEDDDDEDDEDESVDFLAAARHANPEVVRAQEREYDSNIAERLAEEIPAGSSAATAGGGSGFNSPNSVIAEGGSARGPSLKRARTSDSLVVHGKAPKVE